MLEFQSQKGGIPTSTPPQLTPWALSLPPILYIHNRNSIPNYSKALRGLPVLSRVIRIFTHTSISPGPLLRQCPNHYAFHAGRNLPDKEFRYLRTVIVTAAVHWGFNSELRIIAYAILTLPLNLPALGRCHPLYITLRFSRELCFW